MAALASATLALDTRSSGLALLNTIVSLARLLSSVICWMWSAYPVDVAVTTFFACLVAGLLLSMRVLEREACA